MTNALHLLYAATKRLVQHPRWYALLVVFVMVGMIDRRPEKTDADEKPPTMVAIGMDSVAYLTQRALSLQGVPYVYGGKTEAGFDCSGFAQYVYKGIDIQLPGSSRAQFKAGTTVTLEEAQRGDLVFFSIDGTRINHVGIVLENHEQETTFVHATTSRGVRVDRLANPYYADRFVGVRSILQN